MDACYFGVVVGGCLDPHVLQQPWYYFHWQNVSKQVGRMAGLVCRRLRRTLADKKIWRRVNFLLRRWQFLRQSRIERFQVLKNFSHTITNTCKNMHKCMNCKTLAHIAKNYCFCPFTCIPTRLFQWLNEWMNIHFPFPAAPLQLLNQILSNKWSSNIGRNKKQYPCFLCDLCQIVSHFGQ